MSMDVCRVTTGEARFSFVHVFKPYAFQQGQEEKYSISAEDGYGYHGPHQCGHRGGEAEGRIG